jgi:hypothetical protein
MVDGLTMDAGEDRIEATFWAGSRREPRFGKDEYGQCITLSLSHLSSITIQH